MRIRAAGRGPGRACSSDYPFGVTLRHVRKRDKAVFVVLIAMATALGSILAMTFFALLRSKGVDLLIALPLALMAFSFGLVLISLVWRIGHGVTHLWRMRR